MGCYGLGLRVWGLGGRVEGLGFRVSSVPRPPPSLKIGKIMAQNL